MRKLLLLLIFPTSLFCLGQGRTITIADLVTLSSLSQKSTESYLNRKGFIRKNIQDDLLSVTFIENRKPKSKDTVKITRSINLYKKENKEYYLLHTSSSGEYTDWKAWLKNNGFLYDSNHKDNTAPAIFQRRNIKIITNAERREDVTEYIFSLQKKESPNPATVQFAEDLLEFDSHEYLVSFFGQQNVKQDVYYFTEKELKKCSVIFPNTDKQVIFIWNDEINLSDLSYILISGILPTIKAVHYNGIVGQNNWNLKNGISSNMNIRELLELNGEDFQFYGRNSEFSYMVVPESKGKIDFKKVGLTLGCFDCSSALLDREKIRASDAINNFINLYIVYIMIMR